MSSQQSSRHPFASHSRNRIDDTESYQKSGQKYYTSYEPRMALSSSPLHSSLPPMSPYSTRHAHSDTFIRSSPEIGLDTLFHSVRDHMDDPSFAWGPRYSSNEYPERAFTPLKHDYFSTHSYPPLSDFDASEYSEDVDHDIPKVDSEHTSDSAPSPNSVLFSDAEEEENYENDGFNFGHGGYRTTFFRTSAERGQWKSHPIPFKSTPLPQARNSASIPSKLPTPVLVDSTRTYSEPSSIVTGLGFSVESDQYDNIGAVDDPLPISSQNAAESELQHKAKSPHTMSSVMSDWESVPDIDGHGHRYERPSSPLPPSSPMSYSASRSVSPTSSPLMRPSSSLSEISSLDQEEIHADEVECVCIGSPDIANKIRSPESVPTFDSDANIKSGNVLNVGPATATATTPSLKSDSISSDFQVLEFFNDPSSSSAVTAPSHDYGTKHPSSITGDKADISSEAIDAVSPPDSLVVNRPTDPMEDQSHPTGIVQPKTRKPAQKIEDSITQMKTEDDNNQKHTARRKRKKGNDQKDEHPILKKQKNEKARAQAEKDGKKNAKQQVPTKLKRHRKLRVEVSISCPASSSKRNKLPRPLPKASSSRSHLTNIDRNVNSDRHSPLPTQDPTTAALNAELCGMLIETMALSRASSLPLSSLYKMVMQTQPSLKSQRSEKEWLTVFARVLQEGEAGHGSGVFGKVESSGKDESNLPLEAQWFYVPEQDQDQERAALIRSMMPRPAKRTETKKYKQYYWRPLDKISKWDPEDEL